MVLSPQFLEDATPTPGVTNGVAVGASTTTTTTTRIRMRGSLRRSLGATDRLILKNTEGMLLAKPDPADLIFKVREMDFNQESIQERLSAMQNISLFEEQELAPHFRTILSMCYRRMNDPEIEIKQSCLKLLLKVLRNNSQGLPNSKPTIDNRLFSAWAQLLYTTLQASTSSMSDQVLTMLASFLAPDEAIRILLSLSIQEKTPVLCFHVSFLSKLVSQCDPESFSPLLSPLASTLTKWIGDESRMVRMKVVNCFARVHALVGEQAMQEHLSSLTSIQCRLIKSWVEKNAN